MKCAVTTCENEADPNLVHKYTGKTFCVHCARKINQWDSREKVIPGVPDEVPEMREIRQKPKGFITESTDA